MLPSLQLPVAIFQFPHIQEENRNPVQGVRVQSVPAVSITPYVMEEIENGGIDPRQQTYSHLVAGKVGLKLEPRRFPTAARWSSGKKRDIRKYFVAENLSFKLATAEERLASLKN
ncbi:hypothetical protein NQ315_002129 [Exocentrus adspersus]|uniref:Uncharacterized protein n=1 Tax=Exocentrus adspersus TaxID=1586481 RepID=A0AAV8VYX1_9CUCU|nr:hypothetical protein NQ315_002129 [Exocentrus adspersus]